MDNILKIVTEGWEEFRLEPSNTSTKCEINAYAEVELHNVTDLQGIMLIYKNKAKLLL